MCNFIIRPIESYATNDVQAYDSDSTLTIPRGEVVYPHLVTEDGIIVSFGGSDEIRIPINVFVHSFTASPDDIKGMKEEENDYMGLKQK